MDIGYWGLSRKDKSIYINDVNIRDIIDEFGTPTHIINEGALKEDIKNVIEVFKKSYSNFQLFYSYKTNWTPAILKILLEQKVGAEVISPFELWLARAIGVPSNKIIYNGIIKPEDGLINAIKNPINIINIDTLREIEDIRHLAQKHNKRIDVGLRLCPPWGWNAQFGLSLKDNEAQIAVREILKYRDWLNLKGLLVHCASGFRNSKYYEKELNYMFSFAKYINREHDVRITIFDIGGGLGVPTVENMSKLEIVLNRFFGIPLRMPQIDKFEKLESIAPKIGSKISNNSASKSSPPPMLHMELGRALVSRCQFLVLKVFEVRKRGKKTILITDGGRNNTTFPMGWEKHFVLPLREPKNRNIEKRYYTAVGRICSPSDWVFKNLSLERIEKGDYLLIMDTGAYFTSHSNNFSFPRPAIVMVNGNDFCLARERESYSYMVGMDKIFGSE